MVRPSSRLLPSFAVPAVAAVALGFVVVGVRLGTVGLPDTEARDPAPVLSRPAAAQIVVAGRPASALLGMDAPSFAPLLGAEVPRDVGVTSSETAGTSPASVPGPQSVPAPGAPPPSPPDGGAGDDAGVLHPVVDALFDPVPPDVESVVHPAVDPVVVAADSLVGGL